MEGAFVMLTAKGDVLIEIKKYSDMIMDCVLGDIGVKLDAQDKSNPYLKSARYEAK
jgi:hypothetical protein